jgi:L-rhamnose mutarotase
MFSIGQVLKLKPGYEQEYKHRHDELWPEMAEAMRQAGVSMAIYLHENFLFVFATASDQQAWDELERNPITPRWDRYMSDVLEGDGNGKPFLKSLRPIFAFGEFAEHEIARI